MHPLYSVPLFVTSALTCAIGLYVFWNQPKERLNQYFCLMALSVAHWAFFYGLIYCSKDVSRVLTLCWIGFYGVVLIPTFFVHFMVLFLRRTDKLLLRINYGLASLYWLANSIPMLRHHIYSNAHEYFFGLYPLAGKWIYASFITFFYGAFGLSVFRLWQAYSLRSTSEFAGDRYTRQIKYVLLANAVASLSVSDYLPNYGIGIYPFAYVVALGWLLIMAYAILKHKLMDLHVVVRATLLYSFVTAGLASSYAGAVTLLAYLIGGRDQSPFSIISIKRSGGFAYRWMTECLRAYFSGACVIIALVSIGFGCFVWWKGRRQVLHRSWMGFCASVSLWCIGIGLMVNARSIEDAIFWQKWFQYPGAIFIPIVFLHFVLLFTKSKTRAKLWVGYSVAFALQFINIADLLAGVKTQFPFRYYSQPLPAFHVFSLYFLVLLIYAHSLLIKALWHAHNEEKNQIKFILLGTVVGFGGGSTAFLFVYNVPVFPYGVYLVPFYIVTVSYAIFRHRLMDIDLVIRKTLLYSIVSAALASVYVGTITLIAQILGNRHGSAVSSALAAIFITLLFNPLRYRLQKVLDRKFARSGLLGGNGLMKLSTEVIGHENLEKIAESVGDILDESVHPKAWALYLRGEDDREYVKVASIHAESLPERMPLVNIWSDNFLANGAEITAVGGWPIAVPLMGGRDLLGFLLVEEKKSQEYYDDEDMVLLRLVSNQAAVAFERSKIAQRLSSAFVHEIKTPLANIALPAELTFMDMDDLASGGKLRKELIQKIKKRMKYIMDQALLAGTRVDAVRETASGKDIEHGMADLIAVLKNSLHQTSEIIRLKRIHVDSELPDTIDYIPGSARQLEIVFSNLIKNAVEAMAEESKVRERNLSLRAYTLQKHVLIEIADNGPGVFEADLPLLFQPQYTTKGPRGAGTGLYLCQKIIQAHHGSIEVSSHPGQGTLFSIKLPRTI